MTFDGVSKAHAIKGHIVILTLRFGVYRELLKSTNYILRAGLKHDATDRVYQCYQSATL